MSNQNKEIIFLLGAGFNQEIEDFDKIKPPMANNFFRLIKQNPNRMYSKKLGPVYQFIENYWKINEEKLSEIDFNLEKLLTFIQLKFEHLDQNNEHDDNDLLELGPIIEVDNSLMESFIFFLQDFANHVVRSPLYINLGKKLKSINPTFITFNYDLILEQLLQISSGVIPNIPSTFQEVHNIENFHLPDELIKYSHYHYNVPLAYNIKFNIVQPHFSGIPKYESGEKFYKEQELYDRPILKLHGSLNWVRIKNIPSDRSFYRELDRSLLGKLLIINPFWDLQGYNDFKGWKISPHIITPVLYKSKFYTQKPFPDIWNEAKARLSNCKTLVVIGYSFPQTDFHVEKLFLDSFETNELENLIIVNPDTSVVKKIKNLTHYTKSTTICSNLEEFLKDFDNLLS